MEPHDLNLIGGIIVNEGHQYHADLGIRAGKIALIAAPHALPPAAATLDAHGLLVLPGAIDIHFHCRTPGYDERGDFYTETCAAAAGGVTTIFEMPISNPGCATPATFANRRRLIEQQAIINVALYGAPGTLIASDVQGMAAAGAIAYKIFMHRAPLGRADEFIGICLTEDEQIYQALALVRDTGRRLVVHCESDSMLEARIAALRAAGRTDLVAHMESRPPVVEAVAIARLLTLAADLGAPVHIAHVSSAQALATVRQFQQAGVDVTAETCPHYLFFTEADYLRLGPYAKINPPLRTAADQHALWQGLQEGTLSVITTDHATYLPDEKERGWTDIWRAPSGAPGVQTLLPVLLTAALEGQLRLTDAVRWISHAPAQLFGLYPHKGTIRLGADADLCLYDPQGNDTYRLEQMHSKARAVDRLYRDRPLRGRVVATLLAGRVIFREGAIIATPGSGSFLAAPPTGGTHA
ncbi:MAG: dihydroorotase family protein [Chloroflexaceae bacterium]|nr:dihydroorotase family protein [Chloroflexaceae bacterium]